MANRADKNDDILNKEEIEKLEGLDWNDISADMLRNKEMVRQEATTTTTTSKTASGGASKAEKVDLTFLHDVPLKFYVEVGTRKIMISEILNYGVDSIVELDSVVGQQLNIFVNDVLIGLGVIVEKEQRYGIKITKLLDEQQRMEALSAKAFAKK